MAVSEDSDHFSDIFDSNSDLTLVIGHLDRKLRISEEAPGDVAEDEDDQTAIKRKSRAQPQLSATSSQAAAAIDSSAATTSQINKGAFPSRPLSTSEEEEEDDEDHRRPSVTVDDGRGACVLQRAAMEIIDSESSYVMDLQQVIEGYLHDWKERACLKLDELETLFGNIEQLYAVNSRLNERLKETQGDVEQIAKCFLDLKDEFLVYTTYCTRYPDAIALLTRLLQSTHTNSLLTSTQKVLNHTLPLGSYLLKPVQRILKYHLLLDNLRKHCNVPTVDEAHKEMLTVARDIDQMKKRLEQKGRVKQLCGIMDGWMGPELTVLGELRHEGVLVNNNKPREVFLFDTMMIIAKPKEDKRLQFKNYIHRKDIMLVEQIPGEPCSFFVIPYSDPRNQIKFVARNRNQKRLWAHHIKAVMLEDLNIPNRAKDLVFQLGDEEDIPSDKSIKKWGHTSTPDYLERRHRYRRSEIKSKNKTAAAAAAAAHEATKDSSFEPCCAQGKDCNCAMVRKELKEGMAAKKSDVEAAGAGEEDKEQDKKKPPINQYTSHAMPKRIINLKKTRSKTVPSSVFYATLGEMTSASSSQDLNDSVESAIVEGSAIVGGEVSKSGSREQLIESSGLVSSKGDEEEESGSLTGSRMSTSSEASANNNNCNSSVPQHHSDRATRIKSSAFRASDSHLNYNKTSSIVPSTSSSGSNNSGQLAGVLTRSNTISTSSGSSGVVDKKIGGTSGGKVKKNNSSLYKSFRSVKEGDTNRMSFQHLPGSSDLGERIANVDYADPRRLFCVKASTVVHRKSEIIVSSKELKSVQQRDSVMSFTSSSDSVDENRSKGVRPESLIFDRIGDDSYYEEDIDRCLEDASLFRDSAIYSDDNDQRRTTVIVQRTQSRTSSGSGAAEPPPVPYKPKHVTQLQQQKLQELHHKKLERQTSGGGAARSATMSPGEEKLQRSFLYKGNT